MESHLHAVQKWLEEPLPLPHSVRLLQKEEGLPLCGETAEGMGDIFKNRSCNSYRSAGHHSDHVYPHYLGQSERGRTMHLNSQGINKS